MPEASEAAGRRGDKAYRAAFMVGVAAYGALFVGGISYTVAAKGRLPEVGAHPLTQADELADRGDLARAAQQFGMASLLDRTDIVATRRAADLRQRLGDESAQVEVYARQRDLQPFNAATHRNLAQALYNSRRFDEAVSSYQRAIRLEPGDARAYAGIGEVRLEQERLPEARQAFQQALDRDPSSAAVQNSLGIVAALSRSPAEAVSHFEQAVRLRPGVYEANLARARTELAAAERAP
jgi:tetratricopeptide (TPR) repeat protein